MRLIRSVLRPANISLTRQLLGERVINSSNESLNTVVWKHNLDHGSNMQWRGKAIAASVPSDNLPERKPGKRIPKHERKLMVENYVNKYRAENGGKFPTASETKKDMGGSYYVIREILQELQCDPGLSYADANGKTLSGIGATNNAPQNSRVVSRKEIEKEKSIGETKELLSTQIVVNARIAEADPVNASDKSLKSYDKPESSISVEESMDETQLSTSNREKQVEVQSNHSIEELEDSLHSDPMTKTKQKTSSEDKMDFDKVQQESEEQKSTKSEALRRELYDVPTEDAPHKKSSLWQNLKSFAIGIFNNWSK